MMWLVRMALKRPYTFVVMSMLIVIVGALTISRMATDIFPDIDIPVISVVFNYTGLSPTNSTRPAGDTRPLGTFFGEYNAVRDPRIIQLAAKLYF